MLHYLIDAYNLIHQDKDLEYELVNVSAESAAEKLFQMLSKFAAYHNKKKFTLIFDGIPFDIHSPFQNVYIEGSGRFIADDIIKGYISSAVNAKNYIVVSSDKEIINFAKLHLAEYYLSEQFILELRMFNNTSVDDLELDIYNTTQKDEFQAKDLLLKYFNENPLDPNTLEEVENTKPVKDKKINTPSKKKIKQIEMVEEDDLNDDDLKKLIDFYS